MPKYVGPKLFIRRLPKKYEEIMKKAELKLS